MGSHCLRALVIAALRIGQTGIGVTDQRDWAPGGQLADDREKALRTHGTIEAEGHQIVAGDRRIEGFQALAGQRAPKCVADRDGHDDGKARLRPVDAVQGRLDIERVETGLHEDQVHPTPDERFRLLPVSIGYLVETAGTPLGTEIVGHQREGLGSRAHAARHPDLARGGISDLPGQPRGGECHLRREYRQSVIPLHDGIGTETVGLDDIGPGVHIGLVDGTDHIRSR